MTRKQLREWPWNNQPSKLHVWKLVSQDGIGGHTARCERCARTFIERADTRGPVYCFATPEWLAAHPDDAGKVG
jgi:hypothetical protein